MEYDFDIVEAQDEVDALVDVAGYAARRSLGGARLVTLAEVQAIIGGRAMAA